ncbi:ABC transporter ATP-binding protein [Paenibacillus woosongensis]|uniref:ATP-binding cassette domain-containing protein n=1 Tax=Paenibacillus woosongensis TaxID=307580 RepID=A0A7X2Z2M0_9BACL|nr:ABC transporter ATP-binding protein [Paenibacillus woosongensis]MUG46398.1 ATP-binding cassette domain-containing protein [Paenibacillus woosongensis]
MLKTFVEPFRHPYPKLDANAAGSAAGRKPKAKAKNWSGTLGRIWQYLARRKAKLALVLLMVVASSALALLGPYLIGVAVDDFLAGGGGAPWVLFLTGLGAVYIGFSLSSWLQNIWMIEIAQETVYRMRIDLFRQLHRLPIPFFGTRQQGEIMSRLTNDIDNVSSTLNSSAIQIFSSVLTLIGTLAVMLYLSPLLTLLTFMIVPLMMLGMRWITRRTGPLYKERQKNLGELNGYIEETLSGQRIIKAFSQEERVMREFRERNDAIRQSGFWAQTISGFIPKLMNALNNLGFALVAGVGGILAIRGAITVGVIIVFVEYSRQFTRPLNDLANQWNTLLSAIAGAERVFEVMDEEVEERDEGAAVTLQQVEGAVRFSDVSFSYEEGGDTLEGISFEAKPGEMIALVGPTGAGKTTLIQLLSRFYNPSKGVITVDGRDITSIRRESLRSHMAFVLQDSFLFKGTIRENIRFGRLDATDEEVEEASRLANAHSFIMRLQDGYDKMLDADGSGISQGQRQLLAIARAILANPSILVLDEATSSIDTVTELKIQEGLQRLMKGRTSFVIAHRLNTIRQADKILVLKDGRLIEQGSHEELLRQEGFYSELYHGTLQGEDE